MKKIGLIGLTLLFLTWFWIPCMAAEKPGFDVSLLSDMSNFDPNQPAAVDGETIKIGLLQAFSGPAAQVGEIYWLVTQWVAHDINKRGGILVDGKKKRVEIVRGDTMSQPVQTKKETERLCVEEKVDVLWGTPGSHLVKVIQSVAKKHKTIFMNPNSLSDDLMNGKNFNRYSFQTSITTSTFGAAAAYYYAARPEKKFYILCQDYLFGHDMAEAFRAGLKKYKPDAEIVGEDFHPLFTKDFAPYLAKIKASGAEVIYTSAWIPDSSNLFRQARQMGIRLPFANLFLNDPATLAVAGPEGAVGLVNIDQYIASDDTEAAEKFGTAWNDQWKKWDKPYNSILYKWPGGAIGAAVMHTYWLLDVIGRAGSTDAEKIIAVWEGDEWQSLLGVLKMRACDHRAITDMYATEYVYPNPWFEECASIGEITTIPAAMVAPPVPEDLERCGGKQLQQQSAPDMAFYTHPSPAFTVSYPASWNKETAAAPKMLRAVAAGGLPVVEVFVSTAPEGTTVAMGCGLLRDGLDKKFSGAGAKILAEAATQLPDGTPAHACEAKWLYEGFMELNTFAVYSLKDGSLVSVSVTSAGTTGDELKKLPYSQRYH